MRRGRRGIGVVQHGQQVHQYDRRRCAADDVGHTAADARVRPIRQRAEERQQEQRQHIIRRHDRARNRLVQVESIRQDQRHHAVIHLPENADGQKRQTDQHGALGVELHGKFRPFIELSVPVYHVLRRMSMRSHRFRFPFADFLR